MFLSNSVRCISRLMDLETENCLFVEETRRLRLRLQEDKEGVLAYSPKPGSEFRQRQGLFLPDYFFPAVWL
jgi:hypothetical protein